MSSLALSLPCNYVEIDSEEMVYVDGGKVVTQRYYGWDVYYSAQECNDIGIFLSASAVTAASVAAYLGLTGYGIPVALALTIAGGVMGVGAAFWLYAGNHGGLNSSNIFGVNYFTFVN